MVANLSTSAPGLRPAAWLLVGLGAWLVGMVAVGAPLAARILLLGPLVIVPALLGRLPQRSLPGGVVLDRLAPWAALVAALPLVVAIALPIGAGAALATLPWLAFTSAMAAAAVTHGLPRLAALFRPGSAADLATDAAFAFVLVGAVSLLFDRIAFRPLGISTQIILLTAVHFHIAGFGLVSIAGLAAQGAPRWPAWPAVLALVVGTGITALGFIVDLAVLRAAGGVAVGLGGLGVAWLIGRSLERETSVATIASWLSVAALTIGMLLALTWAVSIVVKPDLLDIDLMVRTHGVLNALAVTVLAVIWRPAGEPG